MTTNYHPLKGTHHGYHNFPCCSHLLNGSVPLCFREPCLKPLSYMAAPVTVPPMLPLGFSIWVAAKHKGRGWLKNVFVDDQGFPDQSDKYDTLLHNINGGPFLRKLKHPPPPLDVPDPQFHFPFKKALHDGRLWEQLLLFSLQLPTM